MRCTDLMMQRNARFKSRLFSSKERKAWVRYAQAVAELHGTDIDFKCIWMNLQLLSVDADYRTLWINKWSRLVHSALYFNTTQQCTYFCGWLFLAPHLLILKRALVTWCTDPLASVRWWKVFRTSMCTLFWCWCWRQQWRNWMRLSLKSNVSGLSCWTFGR
jgi:hypothetical protein